MSRAAIATIHLGALRRNLARVRNLARGAKVMAIVKADGYGHGLERVARALLDADAFGVAALGDGLRLRAAGIASRIVVLSGPDEPADLAEFRRLRLEAVIHHEAQLRWLEADRDPRALRAWLKIDTGMHRLGIAPENAHGVHRRLRALANVDADIGLMTHFAASDEFDNPLTAEQARRFATATAELHGARSLANSAAVLRAPRDAAPSPFESIEAAATQSDSRQADSIQADSIQADSIQGDSQRSASRHFDSRQDWVRVGGLLYGLSVVDGKSGVDLGFEPAMTLSAKLIACNLVRAGEAIGYAATWRCPEDMPVGVAAIGYGDGYPRQAASATPVLVGGALAAVVGRVSMDLITLDLRNAPAAQVGDRVVLWGRELPAERVAAHAGTISYDLTCGLTKRVLYTEDDD